MDISGPDIKWNDRTFDYWANQPHLSSARSSELSHADILLWPILVEPPFEDGGFLVGTGKLMDYFRQQIPGLRIEVCAEEEKSCEWVVAVSDELKVAFWAVLNSKNAKMALQLLQRYVYATFGPQAGVSVKLAAEGTTKLLDYEGPVEGLDGADRLLTAPSPRIGGRREIFGDPLRFGIEYEIADEFSGVWLYGHACYWIGGNRVGDFKLTSTLRDLMLCWERMTQDANCRTNKALMALEKGTLIGALNRARRPVDDDDPVFLQGIDEHWEYHDITPRVDDFHGWTIYLVEGERTARCLYFFEDQQIYHECALDCGEFDRVLAQAAKSLRQIHDSLPPKQSVASS